jgi:hypothetical protein
MCPNTARHRLKTGPMLAFKYRLAININEKNASRLKRIAIWYWAFRRNSKGGNKKNNGFSFRSVTILTGGV